MKINVDMRVYKKYVKEACYHHNFYLRGYDNCIRDSKNCDSTGLYRELRREAERRWSIKHELTPALVVFEAMGLVTKDEKGYYYMRKK